MESVIDHNPLQKTGKLNQLTDTQKVNPGEESTRIENDSQKIEERERNSSLTLIAEAADNPVSSKSNTTTRRSLPDYNLIELFFLTILLYLGGKLIARQLKKSTEQERKFWNTLLLISFRLSIGSSIMLVLMIDWE